jgi:hypothetical protein
LPFKRDLLDQQIIESMAARSPRQRRRARLNLVNSHVILSVLAVDAGARRYPAPDTGLVPAFTMRALLDRIPPRVIPRRPSTSLETDRARVKLKIVTKACRSCTRRHRQHRRGPAPAERESVSRRSTRRSPRKLEEMDPRSGVDRRVARF